MKKIPTGNDIDPIKMDFSGCEIIGDIINGDYNNPIVPKDAKISSLSLPKGLKKVPNYFAYWNKSITSITIPSSVTIIGDSAFEGCPSLTSITIPSSVTNIESSAFIGCSKLTSINVNTSNTEYTSINGVLYNKNKTTLIACPGGKTSVSFPSSVTSIGLYAFEECSKLTSITIPSSVTSISIDAFRDCTGLTSITIPDGVTSIGSYAFHNCTALTSITVPWAEGNRPDGWSNNWKDNCNATIIYGGGQGSGE